MSAELETGGLAPKSIGQDLSSAVFRPAPELERDLVKQVVINSESFDIGSDWHLPLDQDWHAAIISNLRRCKGSEILLCVGDVFDTPLGQDSSEQLSEFFERAALEYSLVFFVPGNHDLRGRVDPLASLTVPEGVLIPDLSKPLKVDTGQNKIVLGNIFYDLKFIDPAVLDISQEGLLDFYRGIPDGKFLLNGNLESFPQMSGQVAAALTPDVDLLITHALPHPALVTFRVAERTPEIVQLEERLSTKFVCNPAEDAQQGARWNDTAEGFRKWWNLKSLFMGSNVLDHPAASYRDGLTCIYGHNHRSDDRTIRSASGRNVRLVSYQNPGGFRGD